MVVLHVDLLAKPGSGRALEETYRKTFRPAISAQKGFVDVALLRSNSQKNEYRLVIVFREETLRKKWVATDLHQRVWSLMEAQLARYSGKTYDVI